MIVVYWLWSSENTDKAPSPALESKSGTKISIPKLSSMIQITTKRHHGWPIICSKEFKYQSPGALNDHLNNHHMQVLIKQEKKNTQTKLTEFCFEQTKVKCKANNLKQKLFRGDKTWGIGSLKIRGFHRVWIPCIPPLKASPPWTYWLGRFQSWLLCVKPSSYMYRQIFKKEGAIQQFFLSLSYPNVVYHNFCL